MVADIIDYYASITKLDFSEQNLVELPDLTMVYKF
jgi:hypothetical protein